MYLFAVAAFLLCTIQSANAQNNSGHVFHVNTSYMVTGQDSASRAERDAMLQEYFTKVTMKNEFVIHQDNLVHFYTDDSREFVTVTEYASWGDIMKAADRDEELEKQAWPDTKKREAFLKKMNANFTYHKDAIYHGLKGQSK